MSDVKLSNIFRASIHGPYYGKNTEYNRANVLYIPRKDGTEIDDEDKKYLADAEFEKKLKTGMNSPTNIRKVWITHRKVVVEYYAGPVYNGNSQNLIVERAVKTNDSRFKNLKDLAEYNLTIDLIQGYSKNNKAKKIKIDGRGLQSIMSPWTLNNLEEVYFDWSVLLDDDSISILHSANLGLNEILLHCGILPKVNNKDFLNLVGSKAAIKESRLPEQLLIGVDKNEVKATMKRLRTICFVSNLDTIIDSINLTTKKFEVDNPLAYSTVWIDTKNVKEHLVNSKSLVIRHDRNAITTYKINSSIKDCFTIKDQQYLFDNEVLSKKVKAYTDKLKEKLSYTANRDKQDEIELADNSVLSLINDIEEQYGSETLKAVLMVTYLECGDKTLNSALSGMSEKKSLEIKRLSGVRLDNTKQ